jgi:hypothetical protein
MEASYDVLSISVRREGEKSYRVEVSYTDPTSQAEVAHEGGDAAIDMGELLKHQMAPAEYGRELARQLFSDARVKAHFIKVESVIEGKDRFLRIVLRIDPSARELQSLRWEWLCHPDTPHKALSTSEKVLFSRFMVSTDFRPVTLRDRGKLTALIAVSAPADLKDYDLGDVDFKTEVANVKSILEGVKTLKVLGGSMADKAPPGGYCTIGNLINALPGVDILYLVSHGVSGTDGPEPLPPALFLQDDQGITEEVDAADLASRIGELQTVPRLVVLASCQGAGDGAQVAPDEGATKQATLAELLARAGVPAVIAMQGLVKMDTIKKMMPVFFKQLLIDGQIDRALAAARVAVRDHQDAWMPVLYTRLKDGRIWYKAGFTEEKDTEKIWDNLIALFRDGKVLPILGPRVLEAAHGASHETARSLALLNGFPLADHEWNDLPRVTQYMGVNGSRSKVIRAYKDQLLKDLLEQHPELVEGESPTEPKLKPKPPRLDDLVKRVGEKLRRNRGDVYSMLARLPGSIYLTTNFDLLLEHALNATKDRTPQRVLTPWRYSTQIMSPDAAKINTPEFGTPLIYHIFGALDVGVDDGLVLTEDDYFDYLIRTRPDVKLIPSEVENAMATKALLFLGFRLTDWHFRVLFRVMMSLGGRMLDPRLYHVAVQLEPERQSVEDVAGAKEYLKTYFGESNIRIYWGSVEDFVTALSYKFDDDKDGWPDPCQ